MLELRQHVENLASAQIDVEQRAVEPFRFRQPRHVVDRVAAESGITHVLSSERDILDGIAFSIARAGA